MTSYCQPTFTIQNFSAAVFCRQLLTFFPDPNEPLIFLCIGSDRLTGDSLGPLVGHELSLCALPDCIVYGTLSHPVHAENLSSTLKSIRSTYPNYRIIAIDAALDELSTIGQIHLHNYPLFPGAGVHKQLPPVGDVSITGVVAPASSDSLTQLSEIHLSLVVQLTNCIVEGLLLFVLVRAYLQSGR